MMSSQAPQGVKISAYLFFAAAVLNLLATCALVILIGVAASGGDEESIVGMAVGLCFVLLFSVLYGAVGYGLLKLQSWSRIAAIVLAVLSLCSFPIGTIVGGIVLYLLFQQEAQQAFS